MTNIDLEALALRVYAAAHSCAPVEVSASDAGLAEVTKLLTAALAEEDTSGWERTRWRQVFYAEVRPGGYRKNLWCETSNELEARQALAKCPGGGVIGRLWRREEQEWREES
jgi:hypothetical protein